MVRAKKSLGQHFLKDKNIARKIVNSLSPNSTNILEIGPGTGVLTEFLIQKQNIKLYLIDVDRESVDYLNAHFPELNGRIIHDDFLKYPTGKLFDQSYSIIGNFPYNISSQIFFNVLANHEWVDEVVCMIQKEVAERISSPEGSKSYGILSVLLQSYFNIEYLFTVNEHVFLPPPKVKSAVIRLKRNTEKSLPCDEKLFFQLVKAAFNQRRKTLRNSIRSFLLPLEFYPEFLSKRPEQLSVREFHELCVWVEQQQNGT